MATTQATLLEALDALYHHPDSAVRSAANRWLEDFQQTMEAWQITDSLLHDPNSNLEILYFCAQTLRTKIQRDFDDLPHSAIFSLRGSLMNLLKKFGQGPASVKTQLCLSLAALAVHVASSEWGDVGIVKWLGMELSSSEHEAATTALLETLRVLPQEAYSHKIAVRPERRREFQKELVSSVYDAFTLLTSYLTQSSAQLLDDVLQAFASWLRLSYGIPATYLASHPLVLAALAGLDSEHTFEAAVDAVSELIHFTVNGSPGDLAAHMPLVQVIVPRVMALRPRFSTSLKIALAEKHGDKGTQTGASEHEGEEEDEATLKGMAYLFTDMAESYVTLIATGSNEAMMIVEVLAEVTSHPDDTIAEITYEFWHRLSRVLTHRKYYESFEGEAAFQVEKEKRLAAFSSTFKLLVSLVSFRVKYPAGFESWRKDEFADFKETRYAVADMLLDAAAVLGGELTLKLLSEPLLQVIATSQEQCSLEWQTLEASLYCIRAIAKAVPQNENNFMPRVMALMAQLPDQSQLLYTASLTIGAYADWVAVSPNAPSLLPILLELLTRSLAVPDDPAAAASLALKHLCDACRTMLGSYVNALISIYSEAIMGKSKFQLLAEDELQLVEGLSMVVSALPVDQMPQALNALCIPVVIPLEQLVAEAQAQAQAQASSSAQHFNANQYITPIDRIANVFRYGNRPEPLAALFNRLWPLLRMIFLQRASDARTMERLCRLCKYAVRSCGKALGDTIALLLEEVRERFSQHQQSCFLYLASEVIKVFSGENSCAQYLRDLISILFGQAIAALRSIQDFTERPDVADDCFLLASRCIRYCPHLFVPTHVFPPLFDCAMTGIPVQHREACRSILTFFKDIFQLCNSLGGKQFRSNIDLVILSRCASLTRILIAALTGALPESRVEEVADVLLSLARLYGTQVVQWSQEAIALVPASVVTESERSTFLQAISSAASGADSPSLSTSIEELSDVCRRNRKVMEVVQNALQPHKLILSSIS